MLPEIETKLRDSFARQSMMRTLGASLGRVAPGRVEVQAPVAQGMRQQQGFAHAALSFALGDTAAGYAALSVMPVGAEVLTAEIKINLLAAARGPVLLARGRVIRPGRRLVVVSAEVFEIADTGGEKLVALLQGTMVPV